MTISFVVQINYKLLIWPTYTQYNAYRLLLGLMTKDTKTRHQTRHQKVTKALAPTKIFLHICCMSMMMCFWLALGLVG